LQQLPQATGNRVLANCSSFGCCCCCSCCCCCCCQCSCCLLCLLLLWLLLVQLLSLILLSTMMAQSISHMRCGNNSSIVRHTLTNTCTYTHTHIYKQSVCTLMLSIPGHWREPWLLAIFYWRNSTHWQKI